MKERILMWLFGKKLDSYMEILGDYSRAVDGWGKAINMAKEACERNDRLIGLTDTIINRYKNILRNAIVAYEFELEQQDYETEEDLHAVVLNEFGMTDADYNNIMNINEEAT